MRVIVVAVYDRATDAYMLPMFFAARGAAIRSFQDAMNKADGQFAQHPDDYDLFELASWDDASGLFECLPEPRQLAIGKQLVTKPSNGS